MVFGPLLSNGRQRVGALKKRACRKNAFKHSYTVECGNRLRVGVRAKNAIVSGLRVGSSKPPLPKNPKYPPPLKRGILWAWRFSCRKNAIFPGAHKIGATISGPRMAGQKIYGHEDFSD